MIDVDTLYFNWLLRRIDGENYIYQRFGWMLHQNVFTRSVGNDANRAVEGVSLRRQFLDDHAEADIAPAVSNHFMATECSWFEMLVALAEQLDFLYDGGVQERFVEMITNMGLRKALFTPITHGDNPYDKVDQDLIDAACVRVDHNLIDAHGTGGLFPLTGHSTYPDQREVEIWEQHAAYFRERLEGVMWTSTI